MHCISPPLRIGERYRHLARSSTPLACLLEMPASQIPDEHSRQVILTSQSYINQDVSPPWSMPSKLLTENECFAGCLPRNPNRGHPSVWRPARQCHESSLQGLWPHDTAGCSPCSATPHHSRVSIMLAFHALLTLLRACGDPESDSDALGWPTISGTRHRAANWAPPRGLYAQALESRQWMDPAC